MSTDTTLGQPDSPPYGPVIAAGLATKLGLLGTALLGIVTAITPLLEGNNQDQTELFAILTTVVAVVTIIGRMLQSAAALLGTGAPR